jgi:hypothetical protein
MDLNYYEQIGVPCDASSLFIRKRMNYVIGLYELQPADEERFFEINVWLLTPAYFIFLLNS